MAAKKSGYLGTVASVLCTSVVGPLVVHLVTSASKNDESAQRVSTQAPTPSVSFYPPAPEPEEPVVAEGLGATPESAWDNALLNGIRAAVLSRMDAPTRARDGANIWRAVLEDRRGLVSRCVDLGCTGSPGFWRREVAVFVDRAALMNRLRLGRRPDSLEDSKPGAR